MKTLIHENKNYLSKIVSTHAADLNNFGIRLCLSANEIFELSHSDTPYKQVLNRLWVTLFTFTALSIIKAKFMQEGIFFVLQLFA